MYRNLKENYPYYKVREVSSLREHIDSLADIYEDRFAYKYKEHGEAKSVSYRGFKNDVDAFGTGLLDMGLDGKHIAVIGDNSYRWIVSFVSVLLTSGVVVPIDRELSTEEIKYILTFSDCEAVIYSAGAVEKKIAEIEADLPNITHYICMTHPSAKDDKHYSLDDIAAKGKALLDEGDRRYLELKHDIKALKELLFTSGTTGRSKGVMLSEECLLFNINNSYKLMTVTDTALSILPYHHAYESTCGILAMMLDGITICINESLRSVLPNFKLYKPTEVLLVPLFIEKIYRGIWDKAEETGKAEKLRKLIKFSNSLLKRGIDLRKPLFSSVTSVFGGRLKAIICGGAPIKPAVTEFFDSIGIPLITGYGITECGPLISINRPNYHRYDSVGLLMPGMEIKIDNPNENGEGEICVKGPNVMMGYYKNEEATKEALRDGWFHTGDIGRYDGEFIYLTGRIKNIILLKNGKNIYPEEIEEKLSSMCDLIGELVVRAMKDDNDDERLLGVEIYPDYDRAKQLGVENVEEVIKKAISEYNQNAASYKVIKKIVFRTEEFEKTTSKKIKRNYNIN